MSKVDKLKKELENYIGNANLSDAFSELISKVNRKSDKYEEILTLKSRHAAIEKKFSYLTISNTEHEQSINKITETLTKLIKSLSENDLIEFQNLEERLEALENQIKDLNQIVQRLKDSKEFFEKKTDFDIRLMQSTIEKIGKFQEGNK